MTRPCASSGMKPSPRMPSARIAAVGLVRLFDVFDEDGLRFDVAGLPRRVPGEPFAVLLREPAPGDEAHDAGVVEKKDGSAAAIQRLDDGVERSVIDVAEALRAVEPVGQPVKRRIPTVAPGEQSTRAHSQLMVHEPAFLVGPPANDIIL